MKIPISRLFPAIGSMVMYMAASAVLNDIVPANFSWMLPEIFHPIRPIDHNGMVSISSIAVSLVAFGILMIYGFYMENRNNSKNTHNVLRDMEIFK